MLLDSHRYGEWADARFSSFDPPGPVVLGQVMEAQARELGLSFRVVAWLLGPRLEPGVEDSLRRLKKACEAGPR